jgi:hypothetical protein
MPLPADDAVSRRDDTLARTRRASRWMTVAASAAAVAFGAAFAHALPGHHVTAQAATSQARTGGSRAQGPGPSRRPANATHGHGARHRLQPPAQPPAQPPPNPPPPVVSGGS